MLHDDDANSGVGEGDGTGTGYDDVHFILKRILNFCISCSFYALYRRHSLLFRYILRVSVVGTSEAILLSTI